jgi:CRP-like cAMP-binding protein
VTGQRVYSVASSEVLTRALEGPGAALELIGVLASRLRDDTHRLVDFATLSTSGRIASRLSELADRFGEPVAEGVSVALPLSQDQLASWCGASREAAVRALRALRTLGVISTGRHSGSFMTRSGFAATRRDLPERA